MTFGKKIHDNNSYSFAAGIHPILEERLIEDESNSVSNKDITHNVANPFPTISLDHFHDTINNTANFATGMTSLNHGLSFGFTKATNVNEINMRRNLLKNPSNGLHFRDHIRVEDKDISTIGRG